MARHAAGREAFHQLERLAVIDFDMVEAQRVHHEVFLVGRVAELVGVGHANMAERGGGDRVEDEQRIAARIRDIEV